MPDTRIQTLTAEIERLRKSRHLADNQLQELLLKLAEVQLNLATQDKTLARLDAAVNGNGHAGLLTRVDRIERTTASLIRLAWMFIAALATATVDIAMHLNK